MIFQTYIPNPPLNHFVERFIYHEGYQPLHSVDRFLPDGNVEIIIDLHDTPKFIYDNETLKEIQAVSQVWASGVRTEPISIHSGKDAAMMIIAFKRGMAYPFFPLPMSELLDSVVEADLIWGREFSELREQIADNKSTPKKFQIVEDFLCRRFFHKFTIDPCIEYALSNIIQRPDQLSLKLLSEKIGYSQKHFISIFRDQVGITPKAYLKIMRFQRAIIEIENIAEINWSMISQDCGFYDQSHFINDFKVFSGFTPEEYCQRKNNFLNYVPVA